MIDPNERQAIIALSELFLDTNIEERIGYVAEQCMASGLSEESLQSLLLQDVAPICARNLLVLAGEWAGFDEDELMAAIEARRERGRSPLVMSFLRNFYAKKRWRNVLAKMTEIRKKRKADSLP